LVRQFRKPAEQTLLELPAGSLEKGEDPLDCAHRELLEECGLKAAQMTPLFQCYLAPGYSSEYMYGFLAQELEQVQAQPEEDEILELESYSLQELLPMITDGRIRDAKTICGVLIWARISGV
jgi:ADP-ribose pyrophosphatase